jgi:hypothetical protein
VRRHAGARTVAPTLTGLIPENTPQGVDFTFSLALSTYRDLKDDGKWDAAMHPTPGGAGTAPNGGSWLPNKVLVRSVGNVNPLHMHSHTV